VNASAATGAARPAVSHGEDMAILDLVGECLIRTDIHGKVLSWNKGAEELYGYRADQTLGLWLHDLVGRDGCEPDGSVKRELLEAGRWKGELQRRTASGQEITVEAHWTLRRDAAGEPIEVIGTARDVTERKSMERALKISDDRYRNLFQAMAASFWELDFSSVGPMLRGLRADGIKDFRKHFAEHPSFVREMMRVTRVIDINGQTVELFGDDVKKEDLLQSVEPFWPEDSSWVFGEAVIAAVTGAPVYSIETTLQSLSGRRFEALFTACFPPESVGKGTLLIGVVDISDRKQATRALESSEARYRHLVQHLPVALVQLDMSGLTRRLAELSRTEDDLATYVETHVEFLDEILDLVRVEEGNEQAGAMLGEGWASEAHRSIAFSWRTNPETIRRSLVARLRGATSYSEETRIDTLDGRVLDVLYTIAFPPALVEKGMNIVGFLDISDRVKAQGALAQVEADLAHAARVSMLGELTASIAHEVNQPLAAITTNAEAGLRWLNRADPDLDEVRELTGSIVSDARRAADVIARVRSMAARRTPVRETIAVEAVIRDVLGFLNHELKTHDVIVATRFEPGLPSATVDRIQLQQVLVNLMVNAIQALAQTEGQPRRLSITSCQAAPDSVRVEIEDNGPGVPSAIRDHAFEAFFTTKERGMGMGLPICRSIIEAHGGQIELTQRKSGSGARFAFTLPSRKDTREEGEA